LVPGVGEVDFSFEPMMGDGLKVILLGGGTCAFEASCIASSQVVCMPGLPLLSIRSHSSIVSTSSAFSYDPFVFTPKALTVLH